jgi:hypothetical protein
VSSSAQLVCNAEALEKAHGLRVEKRRVPTTEAAKRLIHDFYAESRPRRTQRRTQADWAGADDEDLN